MDINGIIVEIQMEQCLKCPWGKALMALRDIKLDVGGLIQPKSQVAKRAKGKPPAVGKGEKVCNKCGRSKPYSEFPTNKACSHGVAGTCKGCVIDRVRLARKNKDRESNENKPGELADFPSNCKICHAVLNSPKHLESHMRVVHNQKAM